MYAIIEQSGSQRKVTTGQRLLIDLASHGQSAPGDTITFDRVLVVGPVGGQARIGQPYVPGASVTARVLEPDVRGPKIRIQKFRPKKGYKRRTGHRQRYTRVEITAINA